LNALNIVGVKSKNEKPDEQTLLIRIASIPSLNFRINVKFIIRLTNMLRDLYKANFLAFRSILNFTKGMIVIESRKRIKAV
jgi:hypothetical protein